LLAQRRSSKNWLERNRGALNRLGISATVGLRFNMLARLDASIDGLDLRPECCGRLGGQELPICGIGVVDQWRQRGKVGQQVSIRGQWAGWSRPHALRPKDQLLQSLALLRARGHQLQTDRDYTPLIRAHEAIAT
jgi:hypothetical protein